MIQLKRGTTKNWRSTDTDKKKVALSDGQPGYDRIKHKLKVGDGKTNWKELPYATGLFDYEILNSEKTAKERYKADDEDITIITYGGEDPDENIVGQVYLQYYDADPEADYVVEMGKSGMWSYRKWKSGLAECWGTQKISTLVSESFAGGVLYHDNTKMSAIKYPTQIGFISDELPVEVASLRSAGWVVWLGALENNSNTQSAIYRLISAQSIDEPADYYLTLQVKGRWKN